MIRLNLPSANVTQSLQFSFKNWLPKEWVILQGVQSIFFKKQEG